MCGWVTRLSPAGVGGPASRYFPDRHPGGAAGPGGRWRRDTDARMPTTWPLVGRADELAEVAAAMDDSDGGVVLAGPPGVGKTRLANECVALAQDRGWSSAVVRANRAAA